ncbi:hypothetical protein GUJ93_ZPchr0013g37935 [Zizania palustris]|uniref:Uncharacterized protein n=1 Tax=Zizania palustris TaxID=103762 RepID=A0A8J5X2A7_ZIZPA|nr:hypothetical protein GUJ93_ZPchr0013g37935 [Zizania palustris]
MCPSKILANNLPRLQLITWIHLHTTRERGGQGRPSGSAGGLGRARLGGDSSVNDVNSAVEANTTSLTAQKHTLACTDGGMADGWGDRRGMPWRHQQSSSRTSWFSRGEEMSWP